MMSVRFVLIALLGCCAVVAGAQVTDEPKIVEVRTVDGVVLGTVTGVSIDGVGVRHVKDGAMDRSELIPWFVVYDASTGGDGVSQWSVPREYEFVHRVARIGHERRSRGDLKGCAASYRKIADDLLGSHSKMSVEVFFGLLEEAILRGDLYDATVSMGALLGDGVSPKRLGAIEFDVRYGVFVDVPMIVSVDQSHTLRSVGDRLLETDSRGAAVLKGQEILDGLRDDRELDEVLDGLNKRGLVDRDSKLGFELYEHMLIAQRHPGEKARADSRSWLESRAESKSGTWIDAWCRLAIGASYLYEANITGSDEMRSRGIVQLSHVSIRFEANYPMLSDRANMVAVESLRNAGRFEEAAEFARGSEWRVLGAQE